MSRILRNFVNRIIPQSERVVPRQRGNQTGEFTFTVSGEQRFDRFLVLGTATGTYHVSPQQLTGDNAEVIVGELMARGTAAVDQIVDVSVSGRAPKNDQALFALAVAGAAEDPRVRTHALSKLADVARTPIHLFQFLTHLQARRGWGRQVRRAVSDWYLTQDTAGLAHRVVTYRQHEGWAHKDVLALAHTCSDDPARAEVLRWAVTGRTKNEPQRVIADFMAARQPDADLPALIRAEGSQLSPGMLPPESLHDRGIWAALLDADRLPSAALLRALPQLTTAGIFGSIGLQGEQPSTDPLPDDFDHEHYAALVTDRITDPERLRQARIHPLQALLAQRAYARTPGAHATLVDALDRAFHLTVGSLPPTRGRTLHAVDVSEAMSSPTAGGLTCSEAAAALVKVSLAAHPSSLVTVFSRTLVPVTGITPQQSLRDMLQTFDLPAGPIDCARPMLFALENRIPVDTFVVYTGNEPRFGDIHPWQALAEYREASGIPAKLIVVALAATEFSIADPTDCGMLDIVGFDASLPKVIEDFSTPMRE